MPIRRFLAPHQMREFLSSCCPNGVAQYAMVQLDSIAKILNHLLALMFLFNIFLFFSSWKVSFLPNVGFSTVLVTFLLCFQNAVVYLILNSGSRISMLQQWLQPTEFLLGVGLGITIGGTILAMVLSGSFRQVSKCKNTEVDKIYEYLCTERKGALFAIWFYSGIVFWLNCGCALLIAIGRHDLTINSSAYETQQYESIGQNDDNYSYQDNSGMMNQQQQQAFPGDMPAPTAPVGNYNNVPEVRSGGSQDTAGGSGNNAPQPSSGEDTRIITSV